MKLKDFVPSATVDVSRVVSNGGWCTEFHADEDTPEFKTFADELLLTSILVMALKRDNKLLAELLGVDKLTDILEFDIEEILSRVPVRPEIYCYGNDGTSIGIDEYGSDDWFDALEIEDNAIYDTICDVFIFFEETIGVAGTSVGKWKFYSLDRILHEFDNDKWTKLRSY